MVREITSRREFSNEIRFGLVVVDFFATWCGPCKMMAPVFERLDRKYSDVKFIKVDSDKNDWISDEGVRSFPTFHFYRNGRKVNEFSGASESRLDEAISDLRDDSSDGLSSALGRLDVGGDVDIVAKQNLINCCFVIDNSASMSGSRWNTAKAGVLNCIEQLTDVDFCTIFTFAESVQQVYADGSHTAVYDAIIESSNVGTYMHIALKRAVENTITYLVILTDGEDNNSSSGVEDVKRALAAVNRIVGFRVILAGVGLSGPGLTNMSAFGNVGDNDIQFKDLKSTDDIKDLFEHVSYSIRVTKQSCAVSKDRRLHDCHEEVVDIPLGSGTPQRRSTPLQVHYGVQCDMCNTFPIVGNRYKSTKRENYDLCQKCYDGLGPFADLII